VATIATGTVPVTVSTSVPARPATYSPVNPLILLPALAVAFLLIRRKR